MNAGREQTTRWLRGTLFFDGTDEADAELESEDTNLRLAEVWHRYGSGRSSRWWRCITTTADDRRLARVMRSAVVTEFGRADRRRPRRRRWMLYLGTLVVTLSAGSLAYATWPRQQATDPMGIVCYADADLGAADRAGVEWADDAVAACAPLWTDGTFATKGAPPLVACVNESGLATVFPADTGLCQEMGLSGLDPGPSPESDRILALDVRIITEINAQPCQPAHAVREAVERIAIESGMENWTVTIGAGWEDATCAKVALDASTRTLTVFGL